MGEEIILELALRINHYVYTTLGTILIITKYVQLRWPKQRRHAFIISTTILLVHMNNSYIMYVVTEYDPSTRKNTEKFHHLYNSGARVHVYIIVGCIDVFNSRTRVFDENSAWQAYVIIIIEGTERSHIQAYCTRTLAREREKAITVHVYRV